MQALLLFALVLIRGKPIIIKLTNQVTPKLYLFDKEDLGNGKLKNTISKDLQQHIYYLGLQLYESKI
jgi:hypothetical protein